MLECLKIFPFTGAQWVQQFNSKVFKSRIPVSGGINLTNRCNLNCVHCYLGKNHERGLQKSKELNASQWIDIIDQVADAGCLYLLITGGEPLLRRDFGVIYRHAKKKGLLVTVFTNGTLISEEILELFSELPPYLVEITLYGATEATYEKISGIEGTYQKCMQGIEKLLESQIQLNLKTILMTYNQNEFFDMKKMADEYGVKFRFDPCLFPCFNGDASPVDLRVPVNEVVALEMADKSKYKKWKLFYGRMRKFPLSNTLYNCGAGVSLFHISPFGDLLPCLMSNEKLYDLNHGTFMNGWKVVASHTAERKAEKDFGCTLCEKKSLCGYCPLFFKLETGSETKQSRYLCDLAQKRYSYLFETIKKDSVQ